MTSYSTNSMSTCTYTVYMMAISHERNDSKAELPTLKINASKMQLKPPCSFFHTQTSEYAILKKFYFLQQVNTPILIISCAFLHALFLLISRLASFSLAVYKRVGILNVTKCVQMYSFYLSSSGNGNHGTASKNRIIICNSTHAVAVDRMVINISISSLS